MNSEYSLDDIKAYHERRKKYQALGYDPYRDAEFLVSVIRHVSGSLLEVGTGRGLFTVHLAKKFKNVHTIDVDQDIINFAWVMAESEKVADKIKFIHRDIILSPLAPRSYDIVASANAFHHFEDPAKMTRTLCDIAGKYIMIADFNERGFDIVGKLHKSEGGHHDSGSRPLSLAGEIMREEGFEVTRHESDVSVAYLGVRKDTE